MPMLRDNPLYIAEITVFNPVLGASGSTQVLYFSNGDGYATQASESPASTPYEARLKQPLDIARTMFSGASLSGRSTIGLGDVILSNPDGALDYLNDLGFDGRQIRVGRTSVLNPSYPSDFTWYTATMKGAELPNSEVRIQLRDRLQIVASAPFQTTKFAGSNVLPDGVEGVAGDLKGKNKPICFGVAKNVSAPWVNTPKGIFQVNDGAIASVAAVRDKGIELTPGRFWTTTAQIMGTVDGSYAAAYGVGLFVVGSQGGEIMTSPDGVTWTSRATGLGVICSMIFANGAFLVLTSTTIATSPDGITWTTHGAIPITQPTALTYHPIAGLYVAGTLGGQVYTSPNGLAWTLRTSPSASLLAGAAYGLGLVAMVGLGGIVFTSQDCVTWTTRATNVVLSTDQLYAITFSGDRFVACGAGVFLMSLDGITWTRIAESVVAQTVVYSAGVFISSSGFDLWTSRDGLDWTQTASALTSVPLSSAANGSQVVFGSTIGRVTYSSITNYASLADLLDDSKAPGAGEYRPYATGGYARVGGSLQGLITMDPVQGAAASDRTAAQLFKAVLARAGLSASDYSSADVTALDAANSAALGFWTMDQMTCADVIDKIARTVGAWWGVDASGVFRIQRLTAPSGSPAITITADDMKKPLDRIVQNDAADGIPPWKVTVLWGRYNTVQATDVADSVDDATRAELAQEWRAVSASDASILTAHPLSQELIIESLFTTAADAQTEADRLLALLSVKRDLFECVVELNDQTNALDINSVIEIVHRRFALSIVSDSSFEPTSGSSLFRVLDIRPNAAAKELTLTVWGKAGSYNMATNLGEFAATSTAAFGITTPN